MKNQFNSAEPSLRLSSYESPEVLVAEIRSEGVLCASGQFEQWNEEKLEW